MMLDLVIYGFAAVAAAVLLSRMLGIFVIHGVSMLPTLHDGEWVLARRLWPWERPEAGEVVIAMQDCIPEILVKRVAVGPGEGLPMPVDAADGHLPSGRYLLRGDNAGGDARVDWIGPVERTQVWGKVLAVIRPWRARKMVR